MRGEGEVEEDGESSGVTCEPESESSLESLSLPSEWGGEEEPGFAEEDMRSNSVPFRKGEEAIGKVGGFCMGREGGGL
jgi:hypothetical protein